MISPTILSAAADELISKCSALTQAGVTVRYLPNRRGQVGTALPDAVVTWAFPSVADISSSQNGRQIVRQTVAAWGRCLDNHEGSASAQAIANGIFNAVQNQRIGQLGHLRFQSSQLTEPDERNPQHWQFEVIFTVDVQVKP